MKRKIVMLIMAGMLTVTSLAGCSSFKPEDVVATVEDQEITAEVANFYARYVQAQYETYYSAFLGAKLRRVRPMKSRSRIPSCRPWRIWCC